MTQYRIISKPGVTSHSIWYTAQYKLLNLFWMNCDVELNRPGTNCSMDMSNVERFIEAKLNGEYTHQSMKVVKVYD